jgi:DNA-binding transcriptional regulator YhcF (GntR family)
MITLDPRSPLPPYEQVREQIAAQVHDGRLPTGTRLPTVRRLADDLGLAANTVARAYRELEQDGVVATRGRNGTVVAGTADVTTRLAEEAAMEFATRAKRLGVTPDDALRMVRRALEGQVP